MKLKLENVLNEISKWKEKKVGGYPGSAPNSLNTLFKYFYRGDRDGIPYFIHFTNLPKKIGFNPSAEHGIGNPYGYYGFPINNEFLLTPHYMLLGYKYFTIWQPKKGINIVDYYEVKNLLDEIDEKYNGKNVSAIKTKILLKKGIDGIFSKDAQMSGDIFSEIVVFKPSNVEIIDIRPNDLREKWEEEMNYGEKLKNISHYEKYKDMDEPLIYPFGSIEQSRAYKGEQYRNLEKAKKYEQNRSRHRRKSNPV